MFGLSKKDNTIKKYKTVVTTDQGTHIVTLNVQNKKQARQALGRNQRVNSYTKLKPAYAVPKMNWNKYPDHKSPFVEDN